MRPRNRRSAPQQTAAAAAGRWAAMASLAWLALAGAVIFADQLRQLPPRRPTPGEQAVARPGALARWRALSKRLEGRLSYAPADYGAVWAARSGRICGVVTRLEARVRYRERFYSEGEAPRFSSDDSRRFLEAWNDCVGDHWVDLRVGTDALGFCAVPGNRATVIYPVLCSPGR